MKKIIFLILLVFWNVGQCFSIRDNPENWNARAKIEFSLDGNYWTMPSKEIIEPQAGEKLYLRVTAYVITDHAFDNKSVNVPIKLVLDLEQDCEYVDVRTGNGGEVFNWTDEKNKGYYSFHAVGKNEDSAIKNGSISNASYVVLEINGLQPGRVSAKVVFEDEELKKFNEGSSVSVVPQKQPVVEEEN